MIRRNLLKSSAFGALSFGIPAHMLDQFITPACAMPSDDLEFKHPGLLHSVAELTYLKKQISSEHQQLTKEWNALTAWCAKLMKLPPEPYRRVKRGPSNNPDIGSTQLSRDSSAAYSLALAWSLSEEPAYADKAIEYMNGWSSKLESIEGHDARLLSGMEGVKFANAAELIRHTYDGWNAADQDRFEAMLRNVFYLPIKNFYPTANGNWDASMIQTMLAMGVFLEDRAMFDRAVSYYREGEGNGAITKYFNEFGQCQESGRDQPHTQMGLGFLGCACEMAWKQGLDLYGEANNRLALGFEYTAKYNLGHEVRYEPYTSVEGRYKYKRVSDKGRGKFAPIYKRAAYHYHYRKGLEMPFTREAAKATIEQRSIRRGWAHFRWTDLMFHRPPDADS